ncbi:MAG: MBL fold metallo-hydrolase RNA specificity domain-containing protein, partial [Pseudorhodoplanes sp.]
AVGRVVNGLIGQGIAVITDRTHLVHVSGHPRRAELEDLIGWVRPRMLIPVHGEALHLFEHASLARAAGVPHGLICRDGDVVRLAPDGPDVIDEVPAGRLYKDGQLLIAADARTIADRRRLGFNGIVSVALALTERGELAADPEIELSGIPEKAPDGTALEEIAYDAVVDTLGSLPRQRRRDPDAVAESVRRALRANLSQVWGKKPQCHVHVLMV